MLTHISGSQIAPISLLLPQRPEHRPPPRRIPRWRNLPLQPPLLPQPHRPLPRDKHHLQHHRHYPLNLLPLHQRPSLHKRLLHPPRQPLAPHALLPPPLQRRRRPPGPPLPAIARLTQQKPGPQHQILRLRLRASAGRHAAEVFPQPQPPPALPEQTCTSGMRRLSPRRRARPLELQLVRYPDVWRLQAGFRQEGW